MSLLVGVVMDPIAQINTKKDTSLALLLAASKRNCELLYIKPEDLRIEHGVPRAKAAPLQVFDDPNKWFELGESRDLALAEVDVILMRKDPPFDREYIYATYILEAAERLGTLVVNKPQSLRDCNEKVFATQFPQCGPPTIVSRSLEQLKAFYQAQGDCVFKPLDGMGGSAIFKVAKGDPNLNVILETLTDHGRETIMGQRFLPEITQGDKRILVVNGEAIPFCLARIPSGSDFRGNLAAGGRGVVQPLSDRDRWIVDQVAPSLVAKGLLFVGLDVIGDYLTEINVTSPTCLREIQRETGIDIGDKLMDVIFSLKQK